MNRSVPHVEPQRSTQVSDVSQEQGSSDLLVNNLLYKQPKALSLATNRTYSRNFFQRDAYTGDRSSTAICDWNTGTSYVNSKNSYLTFEVALTGSTPTANFGSGSAMNCINEIRIRSRSTTELDRLQTANLWSKFDSIYTKSDGYLKGLGSVQGFGPTRSVADAANLSATKARFCIPLCDISPFFRPMKGQLLPPQLSSGLHIEVVFEDYRTALVQKSGTVTGYEISGLSFQLDSVEMTDDVQRSINMESAQNGLEYAYERISATTAQQPSAQTSLSLQVRKAVSQACFATAIVLSSADKIDITKDSLVAVPHNTVQSQFRLGALYFPQQSLNDQLLSGSEAFCIAQQTYDKFQNPYSENSLTLADFKAKYSIMSASFEKDQHLNMSGLPINNSRVLELNCEFGAVSEQLEVVCFLQFCSVARAYIDNIAVAL